MPLLNLMQLNQGSGTCFPLKIFGQACLTIKANGILRGRFFSHDAFVNKCIVKKIKTSIESVFLKYKGLMKRKIKDSYDTDYRLTF